MSIKSQENNNIEAPIQAFALRHDRTWKLSQGISFQSAKLSNKSSSQNVQLSKPELDWRKSLSQNSNNHAVIVSEDARAPFSITQKAFNSSQSSSDTAESDLSAQHEALYPRLNASRTFANVAKPSSLRTSEDFEQGQYTKAPLIPDEPSCTPLGFHIPKVKLESAMVAAPLSPSAYWQYRLYQGPDGDNDKVKVHYCKNKEDTERVAQLFLEEKVIGFDIEWKKNAMPVDGIRSNVSLVQIASERRVALFHIARYPRANARDDYVAPSLKQIMESTDIMKVGVAIKGDCTRLRNHLDIHSRGLLELSHLHKLVKHSTGDVKKINKKLVSLADQVQEHLLLPLWKGDVRSSDWSQDLNHQQTQYAASDSYAGFQLFHVLEAKRKAIEPTPPRPAYAELNLPIRLADGGTVATFDEAAETAEDFTEDISVEELVRDVGKIGINDSSSGHTLHRPVLASPSNPKPNSIPPPPPSPELSFANDWVDRYRRSRRPESIASEHAAKPAELRAYALWHEQALEVPEIAEILRQPPLQKTTVANYVGKAIQSDFLPYKPERIKDLQQYGPIYGAPNVNWEKLRQGPNESNDGIN